MCVLETQRQLKKVGLEGSLIRIFRNSSGVNKALEYSVEIDPKINNLDIEKIKNSCTRGVINVVEEEPHGLES